MMSKRACSNTVLLRHHIPSLCLRPGPLAQARSGEVSAATGCIRIQTGAARIAQISDQPPHNHKPATMEAAVNPPPYPCRQQRIPITSARLTYPSTSQK